MPRENKKRGRRAEAHKRKLENDHDLNQSEVSKRRRTSDSISENDASFTPLAEAYSETAQDQHVYYGALDEKEQEYFRNVAKTLEEDEIESVEEMDMFLDNVWLEAQEKELKLACSQSCSRLFERLIFLSKPARLKTIFECFQSHFTDLVQHRFASHCCEALFIRTANLLDSVTDGTLDNEPQESSTKILQKVFLLTIAELDGKWTYLMTDRFASHAIRVLLTILAGEPTDAKEYTSTTYSHKKTQSLPWIPQRTHKVSVAKQVPLPYTRRLESIISECTDGLDQASMRALTFHPTGSPVLQILLRLELSQFGKQYVQRASSLLSKIIPQELEVSGGQTDSLVDNLVYDPIGSRLVETVVQFAPSKIFKSLYKSFFRARIGSLARNDIASYVVCKVLERVSPEELVHCQGLILPQIKGLAERGRTMVIKALVERCTVRAIGTEDLARTLKATYHSQEKPDEFSIADLLGIPAGSDSAAEQSAATGGPTLKIISPLQGSESSKTQAQVHAALLAQSMFVAATPICDLALSSLADLPPAACLYMAQKPHFSHVLQAALKSPKATLIFRRKLITKFYGKFAMLSVDPAGSHLIDAIWDGTNGMAFLRERVAEELAEAEAQMRDSKIGRAVWRNWRMDLYKRKRGEWARQMKEEAGNQGFLSFPDEGDSVGEGKDLEAHLRIREGQKKYAKDRGAATSRVSQASVQGVPIGRYMKPVRKTGLQLARERFAKANRLQPPAPKVSSTRI